MHSGGNNFSKNCDNNYIWSDSDIKITCRDLYPQSKERSLCLKFCEKKMVCMIFCLGGALNLNVMKNGQKYRHCFFPCTFGLFHNPFCQYLLEYPHGAPVKILQILFLYHKLAELLKLADISTKPEQFLKDLKIFNQVQSITPFTQRVINRILEPCPQYKERYLFFKARIFDLFNSILSMADEKAGQPAAGYEINCAEKAGIILERRLDDPPSVSDLAGMVGVSSAKLKQIFPKVYGLPPYCYLRKLRMEKAMSLLKSGQMNVTETAYEVGYNSLSHFAGLFARHFGIKPSEVCKISKIRPPDLTPLQRVS